MCANNFIKQTSKNRNTVENIPCKGRTPILKAMKPKTSEAASADYTDLSVNV